MNRYKVICIISEEDRFLQRNPNIDILSLKKI